MTGGHVFLYVVQKVGIVVRELLVRENDPREGLHCYWVVDVPVVRVVCAFEIA